MRKYFILFFSALLLLGACVGGYDDKSVMQKLDSLQSRISSAETVIKAFNAHQSIISVQPMSGSYLIVFSDGSSVTIANGQDATFRDGKDGEPLIDSIEVSEDVVVFHMVDGKSYSFSRSDALSITFEADDLLVMGENSVREIRYTVTSSAENVVVEVATAGDVRAKVDQTGKLEGVISIKTGTEINEDTRVIVFLSDGHRVVVKSILFEEAALMVKDSDSLLIDDEGGELVLHYMSNCQAEVIMPQDAGWIKHISTKAMEEHAVAVRVEKNEGAQRSAQVIIRSVDGVKLVYTIRQDAALSIVLEQERAALIDFYNATGGKNWRRSESWCSSKPVHQWEGVSCDFRGRVVTLRLSNNNIVGELPASLGALSGLQKLLLNSNHLSGEFPSFILDLNNLVELVLDGGNKLTGPLPQFINKLPNLEVLDLSYNNFEGTVPVFGDRSKLSVLDLSGNLFTGLLPEFFSELKSLTILNIAGNAFSGPIPNDFVKLMDIPDFDISSNFFSGKVPDAILKHPQWKDKWVRILDQKGEGLDNNVYIPAPDIEFTEYTGEKLSSTELYSRHQYTIFYPSESDDITDGLLPFYDALKAAGVEIVTYSIFGDEDTYKSNLSTLPWMVIRESPTQSLNFYPFFMVVDDKGAVVYWGKGLQGGTFSRLSAFLNDVLVFDDIYCSSDYSRDGKVIQLQKATKGQGINIVLMGDAYSDRQIANGTYDLLMKRARDQFFTAEPFKSFKEYFNVYQVYAVSKNEGYFYEGSESTFSAYFGDGTFVGGDNLKVFEYAQKAIPEKLIDDALIIVLMNSERYAGTCSMYFPDDDSGDYGAGASISYLPARSGNTNQFTEVMLHEAGGHGFAKLADEYVNYDTLVPDSEVQETKAMWKWGWMKNVDFTSDAGKIRWSHFISDTSYSSDDVGIYEGALLYQRGVWRSSENSIMRDNTGGFNAPSREAIYYRIHKLAYGSSWKYNFEDFVKYDAINRIKTKAPDAAAAERRGFTPTAAPVVYQHSWKETE